MNSDAQFKQIGKVGLFPVAILILTVLSLCALVADTLFVLPKEVTNLIHAIDTVVCGVFFLDFLIQLHRAESKVSFLRWGWIDLIASIPNIDFLRWGRLVRILRIIRLFRGVRSLQRILRMIFHDRIETGVASLGLTLFLLLTFSSICILICEDHADGNIKTAGDAIWWSFATVTTVGYGDKYPLTAEGRILGSFLMIAGVGMFASLSGLAASFFLGVQDRESNLLKEVLARLDTLEANLRERKDNERCMGSSTRDGDFRDASNERETSQMTTLIASQGQYPKAVLKNASQPLFVQAEPINRI
jgi:voltage-gated potassium channel